MQARLADGSSAGIRSGMVGLEALLLGLGVSMGRALSELIQHELRSAIGNDTEGDLLAETESQLRSREQALDERNTRLTEREKLIMKRERFLSAANELAAPPSPASAGRNQPCPCRSGLKYKRCHGLTRQIQKGR